MMTMRQTYAQIVSQRVVACVLNQVYDFLQWIDCLGGVVRQWAHILQQHFQGRLVECWPFELFQVMFQHFVPNVALQLISLWNEWTRNANESASIQIKNSIYLFFETFVKFATDFHLDLGTSIQFPIYGRMRKNPPTSMRCNADLKTTGEFPHGDFWINKKWKVNTICTVHPLNEGDDGANSFHSFYYISSPQTQAQETQ